MVTRERKNWKPIVKFLVRSIQFISPKSVLTLEEVGRAMVNAVTTGYPKMYWKFQISGNWQKVEPVFKRKVEKFVSREDAT